VTARLLGPLLLYVIMFFGWIVIGGIMFLAPARFGNMLHDNVGVFPEVRKRDWGKKLLVRILGAGFLAFAVHFAFAVADMVKDAR